MAVRWGLAVGALILSALLGCADNENQVCGSVGVCEGGTVCVGGGCVQLCSEAIDCPLSTQGCNDQGYCVEVPSPDCRGDGDCANPLECQKSEGRCVAGRCQYGAQDDGFPCATGVCAAARCVPCLSPSDCATPPGDAVCFTAACENRQCVYIPRPGRVCVDRACVGGEVFRADVCSAAGRCTDGGVESCNGFKCANGDSCRSTCHGNGDCIEGSRCEGNACVGLLADGSPCVRNVQCVGTCVESVCTTPSTTGGVCDAGDAADCATGHTCIGGPGSGTCLRPNGESCTDNNACVNTCISERCADLSPRGGSCDGDSNDCAGAGFCDGGTCKSPTGDVCDSTSDCLALHACIGAPGGTCLRVDTAACSTNAQCQNICHRGACRARGSLNEACDVGENADCSAGLVCDQGTCKRGQGALCGGSTECASGFCVDGRCCDSACDGTCQRCDRSGAQGQCRFSAVNTDPDNECTSTSSNCVRNTCDGSAARCASKTQNTDCGRCRSCNSQGACVVNSSDHQDCSFCQRCSAGRCVAQSNTDFKNECSGSACRTGNCSGGTCSFRSSGTACGNCGRCNSSGSCTRQSSTCTGCAVCGGSSSGGYTCGPGSCPNPSRDRCEMRGDTRGVCACRLC